MGRGDEEGLRLPDDECDQLYAQANALPAYRRVNTRLRLLREQPYLREQVEARARAHRKDMLARHTRNIVEDNIKAAASLTMDALGEAIGGRRTLLDARTKKAQRRVKEEGTASIISSETLNVCRAQRRIHDLRKGFRKLADAVQSQRARRLAAAMQCALSATILREIFVIGRLVTRMRTTSRLVNTVRYIQRAFRAKKSRKNVVFQAHHINVMQRAVRRMIFNKRLEKKGQNVAIVAHFLKAYVR